MVRSRSSEFHPSRSIAGGRWTSLVSFLTACGLGSDAGVSLAFAVSVRGHTQALGLS